MKRQQKTVSQPLPVHADRHSALEHGCRAVRLDTSDYLTPAVGLYRAAGYREVPAYNENPKADLWFERSLQRDAQE